MFVQISSIIIINNPKIGSKMVLSLINFDKSFTHQLVLKTMIYYLKLTPTYVDI